MCGILGLVGGGPAQRQKFLAALALIAHRGPDGEGVWQDTDVMLGHRRLAIIDLSHAADQPMVDPNSGAIIIFNGEIYNYLEVRQVLRRAGVGFGTASDTEVLLKAYLHWGEAMFSRLNGMFAFAIYDPRNRSIFLARDRFGVKPLYYANEDGFLLFASEPKALLEIEPKLAEPDKRAIYDFLVSSHSFAGSNSFFANILCLPPGHYATFHLGERQILPKRYWDYPDEQPAHARPGEVLEQFTAIFEDAVRLRLRSDVPVGLTLSGGLDSSAILAATGGVDLKEFACFTSVYSANERGEENWARKAATLGGRTLHTVTAEVSDWYATLKKIISHMDAPGFSPAVFPLWNIMKAARADGVPVLLEGQGADEFLAGYPQYAPYQTANLIRGFLNGRTQLRDLISHARGTQATFGTMQMLKWHLRSASGPLYMRMQERFGRSRLFRDEIHRLVRLSKNMNLPVNGREPLFAALMRDHARNVLPPLLQYGDAVSMAHGIEARTPFMDYRLVEWVFRTAPPLLYSGKTKWPVRAYLESKGFGEIARRKDKMGYSMPFTAWIKEQAPFFLDEIFGNAHAPIWSFLDHKNTRRLFDAAVSGHSFASAFHFYKVISLHVWLTHVSALRMSTQSSTQDQLFRPDGVSKVA